jgi:hypothetical protein
MSRAPPIEPIVTPKPATMASTMNTPSAEPASTSMSMSAASAREPTPAISRSSVTCSGVSTWSRWR